MTNNCDHTMPILRKSSINDIRERKLVCPVCNNRFVVINAYLNHIRKHDPPGGFHCRYCEASFCAQGALKQHCRDQHMAIACRMCKETDTAVTFNNETEYRNHIRDEHNGLDRVLLKCGKCGIAYKTLEPYRRHLETACGTIKPYKCDQCFMTFMTKYNLKHHLDSHNGQRKYCCSYCGKNFTQKGRLIEHERSHTGEKPYKCDVCGKCFAHRESIVTHSTIHTGIRLVECKCCHSRFSCHSNLIKHRRARPKTCGQSHYDPPKNRLRKHHCRIPATLNPTSEIKVNSLNKIFKTIDSERKEIKYAPKKNRTMEKIDEMEDNIKNKNTMEILTSKNAEKTEKRDRNITINRFSPDCADIHKDNDDEKAFDNLLNSINQKNNNNILNSKGKDEYTIVEHNNELNMTTQMQFQTIKNFKSTTILNDELFDHVHLKDEHNRKDKVIQYLTFMESTCNYNTLKGNTSLNNCDDETASKPVDSCLDEREESVIKSVSESVDKNISDYNMLQETEIILIKDDLNDIGLRVEEDVLQIKLLDDRKVCLLETRPRIHQNVSIKYNEEIDEYLETNIICDDNFMDKCNQDIGSKYSEVVKQSKNCMNLNGITEKGLKKCFLTVKKQDKSWKCPFCVKIYYKRKSFEKHLYEVHYQSKYKIDNIIGENLLTDSIDVPSRKAILIMNGGNKNSFCCPICDKKYLVNKRLKNHIKKHGIDVESAQKYAFENNHCFNERGHKDHINQCTFKTLNKQFCETENKDKQTLSKKRNFVCDKCGKKFIGRTQLSDHVRSDCGRIPVYQCQECGKCLTTAGILKTHMLLHRKECPFQCNKCNKTFKVKAQYRAHIKYRHTEEKRFKCHLCPKEYPYRESLLTHMTVHTGMKRFLCNGCGKRFTCVSNLQAHRRVQANSCGLLPLNSKATQYLGVQKGNLLMGSKPVAGFDYIETNTVMAKDVFNSISD